jgi:hypothetical protein
MSEKRYPFTGRGGQAYSKEPRPERKPHQAPVLSRWSLSITVAMLFTVIGLVGLWELLRQ